MRAAPRACVGLQCKVSGSSQSAAVGLGGAAGYLQIKPGIPKRLGAGIQGLPRVCWPPLQLGAPGAKVGPPLLAGAATPDRIRRVSELLLWDALMHPETTNSSRAAREAPTRGIRASVAHAGRRRLTDQDTVNCQGTGSYNANDAAMRCPLPLPPLNRPVAASMAAEAGRDRVGKGKTTAATLRSTLAGRFPVK